MVSVTNQLSDFKHSLEFTQNESEQIGKVSVKNQKMNNEQKNRVDAFEQSIRTELDELKSSFDYQENQQRRNNLRIDGVPETAAETWELTEKKVRLIMAEKLKINAKMVEIDRAHRVGKQQPGSTKPRSIVARFLRYKDKQEILKRAKVLKGTNIYINEDVSDTVLEKRKEQHDDLKHARSQGKIAYFVLDRLVIRERRPPQPPPTHGDAHLSDHVETDAQGDEEVNNG